MQCMLFCSVLFCSVLFPLSLSSCFFRRYLFYGAATFT